MRRWLVLIAAVFMQMCLGATYAWAVFVAPLKEVAGIGQGLAQLPFTVFYTAFPVTAVLAGQLMQRLGPHRTAMLGGVCFGSGWLLAGMGDHHVALTVLGIGLLGGVGVGFAYLAPIATCVLWFPRHQGLVTGVAVAGFGGGAALVAKAASLLMDVRGASVFETFQLLGTAFVLLVPVAASCMRSPPRAVTERTLEPTERPGEILRNTKFWLLYGAMFTGLAAGFTINANLKELAPKTLAQAGVTAVGLFAIANAAGRILWGALFDRVATRIAVASNLAAQATLLVAAPRLLTSYAGLHVLAVVAGFNYGGVLVLYAASVVRLFGPQRVANVYGWLFSANIPASWAPLAAGIVFDATGSFDTILLVVCGLLFLAAGIVSVSPSLDATLASPVPRQ